MKDKTMRKGKGVAGEEVKQGRDGRAGHDRARQGRESWKEEGGRERRRQASGRMSEAGGREGEAL
ncbi:hypothetical protein E2C01_084133 [Portunus trituberculatus]|uniref:Uncharacterized protein n=1 Tax=Portunus trituberculatus TaxID=210409 RepID=A0A5B7J6M7_PORTR|nr:hypothetical protein [Portunus trituberculatus]